MVQRSVGCGYWVLLGVQSCVRYRVSCGSYVLPGEQRRTNSQVSCGYCVLLVEQICVEGRLGCMKVRSYAAMQLCSSRSGSGSKDVVVELCKLRSRAMNVGDE
jgi:hypothetical protein